MDNNFATRTPVQKPCERPGISLGHLVRLTDSTGLFRRATQPEYSGGYLTDDNARAFVLAVSLGEMEEEPAQARTLASTYAGFLLSAFDPKTKRFRNLMGLNQHWLDEPGPEDSHGRALWALGTGVGRLPQHGSGTLWARVFAQALPIVADFSSPRAWAWALLGIHEYRRVLSGDRMAAQMRDMLTSRLLELFVKSADADWHWFENGLKQENARLAHALIVGGNEPGHRTALDCGLHTLQWLVDVETSESGGFRPMGAKVCYRGGGRPAIYGQQSSEAQAMVAACIEAYRATSRLVWYERAERAFDWFLGGNDPGRESCPAKTGDCREVLQPDGAAANHGAEATVAFLLSMMEMRSAQNAEMVFNHSTVLTP